MQVSLLRPDGSITRRRRLLIARVVVLLLTLTGAVLLLVTLVTPTMYHITPKGGPSNTLDFGPFRAHANLQLGYQQTLSLTCTIDSSCDCALRGTTDNGTPFEFPKSPMLEHCELWNASRGLFIIGLIFSSLVIILLFICCFAPKPILHILSQYLLMLTAVSLLVPLFLYLHERGNDSTMDANGTQNVDFAYGYGLPWISWFVFALAFSILTAWSDTSR